MGGAVPIRPRVMCRCPTVALSTLVQDVFHDKRARSVRLDGTREWGAYASWGGRTPVPSTINMTICAIGATLVEWNVERNSSRSSLAALSIEENRTNSRTPGSDGESRASVCPFPPGTAGLPSRERVTADSGWTTAAWCASEVWRTTAGTSVDATTGATPWTAIAGHEAIECGMLAAVPGVST